MSGLLSGVTGALAGVSGTLGGVGDALKLAGLGLSWLDDLQTASWRGQPFVVADSGVRRGRRVAVHEYPWRDTVWVEDLGRGLRRIAFRGFLIGDDVALQETLMLTRAELPGPGELVHPTLGSIQCSLVEFSAGQRRELGRVVELEFAFVEYGPSLFPTGVASTQDAVNNAANDANAAISGDFFDRAWADIKQGAHVVQQVVATARGYVHTGLAVVGDAQRAFGAVAGLDNLVSNDFGLGRYSDGRLPASLPPSVRASVTGVSSNVERLSVGTAALLVGAVAATNNVQRAATNMIAAAAAL